MILIVGIKFKTSARSYYFDPTGIDFCEGDFAIVETSRGIEFGRVTIPNKEVPDKDVIQPLKPVMRKATAEDIVKNDENLLRGASICESTRQKVAEHRLNMKITDAEYTFDRSKVIIYFTAEGRIDFRDLVRDLASIFHTRIELRQIYERDDIKMKGSLGVCGRQCCCITHLGDYDKVSIKMAKVQGLSLNPQKISGCCGKLMCCLKYENEHYQETYRRMPKERSRVDTPDGPADVYENNLLRETVKVKFTDKDGNFSYKTYPLAELKVKSKQDIPKDEE